MVLIPDNDADGRAYVDTARAMLAKLNPPASVRVVELPGLMAEGGDIADYVSGRIKDGWPLEVIRREVERLASEATPIETIEDGAPFTVCMEEIQRQPIRWLWKHRIAIGKLTIIQGGTLEAGSLTYALILLRASPPARTGQTAAVRLLVTF